MQTRLVILGSTGSIGRQALQVCQTIGYEVLALTAHSNAGLLEQQAREFLPRYVVITDQTVAAGLKAALADTSVQVLVGEEALCEVAALPDADMVLNSLVGIVGLRPTLAAIEAGKRIALANKETLVAGGALVTEAAHRTGAQMIPVDSEHTAIFQCVQGEEGNPIETIFLTASGGPFLGKTRRDLQHVTMEQALRHPKWSMGAKLTIDSATLMNKGLEFIECVWNFGVQPSQIEVVVHPEAIVHSAVEFADHSVMAQLSDPDMRLSIQYALTYPKRMPSAVKPFHFTDYAALHFLPPDLETFPCLRVAIEAIQRGGLMPCLINGANEEAVAAFQQGRISFLDIGRAAEECLAHFHGEGSYTLEQVLEADRDARVFVRSLWN